MVSFHLIELNGNIGTYQYYPEDDHEKKHGVIIVDFEKHTGEVKLIAEMDHVRIISAEELNSFADVINKMNSERGATDFVEYVTEDKEHIVYAEHALNQILRCYQNGEIPKNGMNMWY